MSTQHSITPPPELVQQWIRERPEREYSHTRRNYLMGISNYDQTARQFVFDIATQAAQWGVDQELEACVNWLDDTNCEYPQEVAQRLRAARRAKPPSLKEQALTELEEILDELHDTPGSAFTTDAIRRALEALDD